MKNLIKELSTPRHNSEGLSIGPSNLERRAANAIKQVMLVNLTNDLVIKTLSKQLEELQNEKDKATTSSGTPSSNETDAVTDSTQLTLFE